MSGSNALQITDPNASDNPLAQAPSWADAYGSVGSAITGGVDRLGQWLAVMRARMTQRNPDAATYYYPKVSQEPGAPPNILGSQYDNLPPPRGAGPLDFLFPDPAEGSYMPRGAVDAALNAYARQRLAGGQ